MITPYDGLPIAVAVVCEEWRNGTETLQAFVQVTTPANVLISRVTDRMPAILPRDVWPVWLGETGAPLDEVKALLRAYEDDGAGANGRFLLQQRDNKPEIRHPGLIGQFGGHLEPGGARSYFRT